MSEHQRQLGQLRGGGTGAATSEGMGGQPPASQVCLPCTAQQPGALTCRGHLLCQHGQQAPVSGNEQLLQRLQLGNAVGSGGHACLPRLEAGLDLRREKV